MTTVLWNIILIRCVDARPSTDIDSTSSSAQTRLSVVASMFSAVLLYQNPLCQREDISLHSSTEIKSLLFCFFKNHDRRHVCPRDALARTRPSRNTDVLLSVTKMSGRRVEILMRSSTTLSVLNLIRESVVRFVPFCSFIFWRAPRWARSCQVGRTVT